MRRHTLSAQRTAWASWFIFANGVIALLIGLRYLPWMNIPDTSTAAYVGLLLPGQFALLAWLSGLPLLVLALILPAKRALTVFSIIYASAGIALLATDTAVYSLSLIHI